MNTVACCAVIGKHPDSDRFTGAYIRCYCERTTGFVERGGIAVSSHEAPVERQEVDDKTTEG
jgi:hypothetical protein